MSIFIVRLGAPRKPGEGLRLGTVRRPPRGVPKSDFARLDYYDVWFPNLAPSADLVRQGLGAADGTENRGGKPEETGTGNQRETGTTTDSSNSRNRGDYTRRNARTLRRNSSPAGPASTISPASSPGLK